MIYFVVLGVITAGVAAYVLKDHMQPHSVIPKLAAPHHIDYKHLEIEQPDTVWLVQFSSTKCDSCTESWETVCEAASAFGLDVTLNLDDVEHKDIHSYYKVDGVPLVLVIKPSGEVAQYFFGPPSTQELIDAIKGAGSNSS